MKIILAGGTGQLGTRLAQHYVAQQHDVVVLGRHPQTHAWAWRTLPWDAVTLGEWARELDGADVVINLAGRSVNCRYNALNRAQIMDSRVHSTLVIGQAIAQASRPPSLWLQSSTATVYAHRYDAPNDEQTGILGGNEPNTPDTWQFSIGVAKAWERAMDATPTPRTRKVKLRMAMVMDAQKGGVFEVLSGLVRRGLGGQAGNGKQFVSWVHAQDFVRALDWLMTHDGLDDAVNIVAPNPLPNAQFMAQLRQAWGVPFGLNSYKWMLEIGAAAMQTETELLLKSRRVVPGKLLASGFTFLFPAWQHAAKDLAKQMVNA